MKLFKKFVIILSGAVLATCSFAFASCDIEEAGTTDHTHIYDDGIVTKRATCVEAGEKTYSCTVSGCTASYIETISATGHNYTDTVVAPTCTEQGYTVHTCSYCGDSYNDTYTIASGHDYQLSDHRDSTDEAEGYNVYTCTRCGDSYTNSLPTTNHEYDSGTIVKSPTCTSTGIKRYTCTSCGAAYDETLPKTEHSFDDGTVTTEPTCTAKGVKTFTCVNCFTTYTQDIAALGHAKISHEAKAATCTEGGWAAYETCSRCSYTTYQETAALGHDYSDSVQCKRCGASDSSYISISTQTDLANISANMSGNYVLTADITLSGNWDAIGGDTSTSFSGIFDGNNHTISNLSTSSRSYAGLFYKNSGTIRNLIVKNITCSVDYYEDLSDSWPSYENVAATIGGIAAYNSGTVYNCRLEGNINISTGNYLGLWFTWLSRSNDNGSGCNFYNSYTIGGMVGENNGTVDSCTVTAGFTYTSTNYMGSSFGILGGVASGCYCINSNVSAGGIVGVNKDTVTNCTIQGGCTLNSNQTVAAWKKGQPRAVKINFTCNFGSVVGDNQSQVDSCNGVECTVNKNHTLSTNNTEKEQLSITIRNDISNGLIGYKSDTATVTNCKLI